MEPGNPPANMPMMQQPIANSYQYEQQTYQPPAQPVQQPQPPTPEPPQPVQRGPIPSEHQVLQDVFDGLKDRCLSAANHPVNSHFISMRDGVSLLTLIIYLANQEEAGRRGQEAGSLV